MIFYIHGFNTGATGTKANQLAQYFSDIPYYRINQSHHPHEAIAQLSDAIQDKQKLHNIDASSIMLIASSLGGFYARYLCSLKPYKCVLINPSIDPMRTLAPAIGPWKNYVTGEKYHWHQSDLDSLSPYYVENSALKGKVLLLLDEEDEVLDSNQAIDCYSGNAQIELYPGGSHQFEHLEEAIPLIKNFYLNGT